MLNFIHGILPIRISTTTRSHRQRHTFTCSTVAPDAVTTADIELSNVAGLRTCKEVKEDIQLAVNGTIPRFVNGRLYRNGPGVFEVTHKNGDETRFRHWFDGIAVVHRFLIDGKNGTVSYKNRRTMNECIEAAESAPSKADYKVATFGNQDPCRGLFGTLFQAFKPSTKHLETNRVPLNISVTLERIVPYVGPLVSRSDVNMAAVLDIDSLQVTRTLELGDIKSKSAITASGAHGVVDPETGAYINYAFEYGPRPEYVVFEVNNEKMRVLARFKERPVYIHSIAVTKKYVVVMLYSSPLKIRELVIDPNTYVNAIDQKSKMRVKFYVISRADAKVTTVVDADPFFCFHTINAYDQDNNIVIDLVKYDDASVMDELYINIMMKDKSASNSVPVPVRFTVTNIDQGAAAYKNDGKPVGIIHPTLITENADIELPRIPDALNMRPYRYTYGISNSGLPNIAPLFNSVVKLDVETGEVLYYTPPDGACGEPIFVANPEGSAEDDGVLLSVVLDKAEEKSFLAVLDARTMKELARALVPQAVPFGFHGQYMTEEFAKSNA